MGIDVGWVTSRIARRERNQTVRRLVVAALLGVIIADGIYLAKRSPNWTTLSAGPCPKSLLIHDYEARAKREPDLPPLAWKPVSLGAIPEVVQRAVIAAEDSQFYRHAGVDLAALEAALRDAINKADAGIGKGTISQQTINNMVLGEQRGWLRKWHEIVLALWMERVLNKERILFLYLNSAELGRGTFGVDAAARAYWRVPVTELTYEQAIQLAATFSHPRLDNPVTKTERFNRRVVEIGERMKRLGWATAATEESATTGGASQDLEHSENGRVEPASASEVDAKNSKPPAESPTTHPPNVSQQTDAAADNPSPQIGSSTQLPAKGKRTRGRRRRRARR